MTSASGPGWDLHCGKWQDALSHVGMVDALISDPPYGRRTHDGNADRLADMGRARLNYDFWAGDDVCDFVSAWSDRVSGWMACMTSDDLIPAYRDAYVSCGRADFAPVPIIQHRPRLSGDGPGSCAVYLLVARPRKAAFMSWGSLPGHYLSHCAKDGVPGGKPVELLRAIVRDYSRAGDLIADPCSGGASTLRAALSEGRRAVGAEVDPSTFNLARRSLARGFTPPLFADAPRTEPQQAALFADAEAEE